MQVFDFLNILALLTLCTGLIVIINLLFEIKHKPSNPSRLHAFIVHNARGLFPVFLIVLLIRSFIFQPYRVPSGSLEPSIMPGDFILVTQFDYGLRLPLWDWVWMPVHHPKRGEVALFRWPVNPKMTFVKRVIGVPGDRISYVNKVLSINGQVMQQNWVGPFDTPTQEGVTRRFERYSEHLDGIWHDILIDSKTDPADFKNLLVPKGMYFVLGDHRDNSDDSRSWGFVPETYFIGHARFVWFSITWNPFHINWERIGRTFSKTMHTT